MANVKGVKEFKVREGIVDVKILVGEYDSVISMRINLDSYPQLAKNLDALASMISDIARKILEE